MNNLEKLQLIDQLQREIESLSTDDYDVCPHYHYAKLRFSAWDSHSKPDEIHVMEFRINENGTLETHSFGIYDRVIAEDVRTHIEQWLKKRE